MLQAGHATRPLLALALLLAASLAGCLGTDEGQPPQAAPPASGSDAASACQKAGWTAFEPSSRAFKLCYPDDWIVREDVAGVRVALFPSGEASEVDFAANLNVVTETVPPGTDLPTYVDAARTQVERIVTDVEIEDSRTVASDPPTHDLVYTGEQGIYELRWQQRLIVEDGTAYVLTYTSDPTEAGQPSPETLDHVFNSFRPG